MITTPVHVFARWKVKAGHLETVMKLLKEVRSLTILEQGNLFYKVHESRADANTLIIFEGYADEMAQKAHMESVHFKKLVIEQIVPLLEDREVILTTPVGD